MEPNLATHDAPLIIIGTPPAKECQFTRLAEEFRHRKDKKYYDDSLERINKYNQEKVII
jgi:hypothetical protein